MTAEIAVSVRDLTKSYRLFSTPLDRLKESLHPFRKRYHTEFWALKGISFDVLRGQIVGILGRNGSGKSTLLQIIASVLRPTSGTVTVSGPVSALLELGAGFNPEFTGRQNVFLNGALMGMSRQQMLDRMPSIMEFADVGEFFDQPMKIYSSGMFVRVAFAAAVHVDPEILIVDEALAVGDAKFQHKCFQRLADLHAHNKTVIFVSHNTSLITSYCDRALLLNNGELVTAGDPAQVVDRYYDLLFGSTVVGGHVIHTEKVNGVRATDGAAEAGLTQMLDESRVEDVCHLRRSYNKNEVRFGDGRARIIDYVIQADGIWDVTNIRFGSGVALYMKVLFCQDVSSPVAGFSVKTLEGIEIHATNTFIMGEKIKPLLQGQTRVFKFSFTIYFYPTDYFFDLGVAEADGSRGGVVLDVRRSVAHSVVSLERDQLFGGLVDLAPRFETLTVTSETFIETDSVNLPQNRESKSA
jgi:lipopolysaccharide transport system ATP-binding protein